ncbi:hypothetical protein EGR_09481 [Echinococcus granulosus]|uniref:Uncharacterized protein n=1 Tax=Echinococcus granulosus TaxID=6210 RepID=W6U3I7_ECHGR|nr:hypothetical protein EGR_09481 [Echinococcus granulosus]EUB55673.1 hypothetical protein EGR_09481 [Echinococcus granulosus]
MQGALPTTAYIGAAVAAIRNPAEVLASPIPQRHDASERVKEEAIAVRVVVIA